MYFYPMEFATVIVVTLVKYHNNLYIIEQKSPDITIAFIWKLKQLKGPRLLLYTN